MAQNLAWSAACILDRRLLHNTSVEGFVSSICLMGSTVAEAGGRLVGLLIAVPSRPDQGASAIYVVKYQMTT
jgi:hypothetical protein